MPEPDGDLFAPRPQPAVIDGRFANGVLSSRHTFVTSRQRDIAVLGGLGLVAAALLGALRRRR